jgi:hypothetical protein
MAQTIISDDLWQEFHAVVNMTSRELEEWLRTEDARESTEALPDQAGGQGLGRRVLEILGKRRTDVNAQDAEVMSEVVDTVAAQRDEQYTTKAGDAAWRHRLMCLGHDPLKPID